MKIKPLVFVDDPVNKYGEITKKTATVDISGMGLEKDKLTYEVHCICAGRDFYKFKAVSPSLGIGPVSVSSFENGMGLCNYWNTVYWNKLVHAISDRIEDKEVQGNED